MTRWRRAPVAAAVALLVGACSGLPTSSPVLAGRDVGEQVAPQARVVVPPPARGASIESVALGFVRAGAAFAESDERQEPVGRSYLAPATADRWRPASSVTVFDRYESLEATPVGPDRVRVSAVAVAVVDATGRYRELGPQTVVETVFDLVQVDGEWRVRLPEAGFGIWVTTEDFGRLFGAYAVTYPARGKPRLVPDVRWFATGPRLLTALARAQLGAVPDYLAGAVETGVPEGARLAVDAVAVQDQTATVVLSSAANTSDVHRRRKMWAQFVACLTQVPGVSAVRLEVSGVGRIAVPDVADSVSSPSQVGYDGLASAAPREGILRVGERLTEVDASRLEDVDAPPAATPGPQLPCIPLGYTGLAMSPDGADLAAVSTDGTTLRRWHAGAPVPVPVPGSALTAPVYDAQSRLWVAGVGPAGTPRVWWVDASTDTAAAAQEVDVPWLHGRVPLSLSVSGEGARMAIVSSFPGEPETRLDVAGIVVDPSGRATALATGHREAEPLVRLVDVAWVDDRTVVVLGALGQQETRVFTAGLGQGVGLRRGGLPDSAGALEAPVPTARAVVAVGASRAVAVVTSDQGVLVRVGGTWRRLGAATELAVSPPR